MVWSCRYFDLLCQQAKRWMDWCLLLIDVSHHSCDVAQQRNSVTYQMFLEGINVITTDFISKKFTCRTTSFPNHTSEVIQSCKRSVYSQLCSVCNREMDVEISHHERPPCLKLTWKSLHPKTSASNNSLLRVKQNLTVKATHEDVTHTGIAPILSWICWHDSLQRRNLPPSCSPPCPHALPST